VTSTTISLPGPNGTGPEQHACLACRNPHQRGRGGWQRNYCSWRCMRKANGLPERPARRPARRAAKQVPADADQTDTTGSPPPSPSPPAAEGKCVQPPAPVARPVGQAVAEQPATRPPAPIAEASMQSSPQASPAPLDALDALDLAWLLLRSATYRALPEAAAKAIVREALATCPADSTSPATPALNGAGTAPAA